MARFRRIAALFAWIRWLCALCLHGVAVLLILNLINCIGIDLYRWAAWNGLTKQFEAVCTEYRELTGKGRNRYLPVQGPYTQEFWVHIRKNYSEFPRQLEPEWAMWQEDGSLRVPIGFDFKPNEYDRLNVMGFAARRRERSHVLSVWSVYDIVQKRLKGDEYWDPIDKLVLPKYPNREKDLLRSDGCGVMDEIIRVGGVLAAE